MPRGRAIWSGAVSFGLVNVPVKLYSAAQSHDIRFNQLEKGTGARIRYKKVSEATGEEVGAEDIVKGYEVTPGNYVLLEPEELAALAPKATHTVDIEEFVDLASVDPLYFDQPYYLLPDKGGAKAYRLLVEAMAGLGRAAVGRIILRSKEHLVALRPLDGVLCLEMLRFADEVVPPADVAADLAAEVGDANPSERELAMAAQLVESLAADWDPAKFADQYRDQVLDLIEKKAAGAEIVAEPQAETAAKVVDLMAALEASIAAAKDRAEEKAEETPAKAAQG